MNAPDLLQVASSLVSIFAIWLLVFFVFRPWRVDYTRQRLFVVRHELFMFAARGKIAFDHPAYEMLRSTINGFIRFADLFGIINVALNQAVFSTKRGKAFEQSLRREWAEANKDLSPEVVNALSEIRQKVHFIMFDHALISPILVVFVIPLLVVILARHARHVVGSFLQPIFERTDSTALIEGREAGQLAA